MSALEEKLVEDLKVEEQKKPVKKSKRKTKKT